MARPAGAFLFPRFFAAAPNLSAGFGRCRAAPQIGGIGLLDQLEQPRIDRSAEDRFI